MAIYYNTFNDNHNELEDIIEPCEFNKKNICICMLLTSIYSLFLIMLIKFIYYMS